MHDFFFEKILCEMEKGTERGNFNAKLIVFLKLITY